MSAKQKTDADRLADAEAIIRQQLVDIRNLKAAVNSFHDKQDTAARIRKVIFGLAEHTMAPPKWISGIGVPQGSRGAPVIMVSDIHYGETISREETAGVNNYDAETAKARLQRLCFKVIDLCENHMGRAGVKYPGLVVCLGGDLIGGNIHEELRVTNDRTPAQAVNELTDILGSMLKTWADHFGRVFVVSVVGNHGRMTLKPTAKHVVLDNFDWIIACSLERDFRDDPRIKFMTPEETDAFFTIYGMRFLLTHGDRLGTRGGDGIIGAVGPIMRGVVKLANSERHIGRDFDYLLMGHWHQLMWLPGAIVNGCVKGYDEYARTKLRVAPQIPMQALFFVHPENGITAHWEVKLEKKPVPAEHKVWVSWAA